VEAKNQAINRPNREPDYITTRGLYFWFDEMIYYWDNACRRIELDHSCNKLRIREDDKPRTFCVCDGCIQNKQCLRTYFAPHVQIAYKDWYIKMTETALLGEPNEAT
jgi:hypothetical protein